MYDKGNNIRIEVTINNPKDFKVMKVVLVQKYRHKSCHKYDKIIDSL